MPWRGPALHRQGMEWVAHLRHVEGIPLLRHVEWVEGQHQEECVTHKRQGLGVVPSHLAVESILRGGVSRGLPVVLGLDLLATVATGFK